MVLGAFLLLFIALIAFSTMRRNRRRLRAQFIGTYGFPARVLTAARGAYPHLTESQAGQVLIALRQYFRICNEADGRLVSMPSQVVDVAWHEFILFSRAYAQFCRRAFGRFLHHTPAEAMSSPTVGQEGLKRAWLLACRHEGIDPQNPQRLPLLFAIDGDLNIADGFRYTRDCQGRPGEYCAAHFGCGGDGGTDCGGDGGSDGGGCGGD